MRPCLRAGYRPSFPCRAMFLSRFFSAGSAPSFARSRLDPDSHRASTACPACPAIFHGCSPRASTASMASTYSNPPPLSSRTVQNRSPALGSFPSVVVFVRASITRASHDAAYTRMRRASIARRRGLPRCPALHLNNRIAPQVRFDLFRETNTPALHWTRPSI
jgi:hypothetical protein